MMARIEARPTARRELAQALLHWVRAVRRAECTQAHLYEDLERPEAFCVVTAWPTMEAFGTHVAGAEFGSLIGAAELLALRPVAWIAEIGAEERGLQDVRRFGAPAIRIPEPDGGV